MVFNKYHKDKRALFHLIASCMICSLILISLGCSKPSEANSPGLPDEAKGLESGEKRTEDTVDGKAEDSGADEKKGFEPEQESKKAFASEEPTEMDRQKKPQDEAAIEKKSDSMLVMFHNGKGPMCLRQLRFLESLDRCPELEVAQHLTTEKGSYDILFDLKLEHAKSRGVSDNFGYLPITFVNGNAYSGFDDEVKLMLKNDIEEICS